MGEVRTRDEAIASVDAALQTWSTNTVGILTQAESVAHAAMDKAENVVRKCANEVAAVEALLSSADERDRGQLEAKLTRSKAAHDEARRARVRIEEVARRVAQLARAHNTSAVSAISGARTQLSAMSQALGGYRSGGIAVSGGGGSRGGRSASGGNSSLAAMGLSELDVSGADLDENPILDDHRSADTFGKGGLSRADYRWAVQTWSDTVGPGVANGKTREDFAQRDERSNAQPLRRTADVYDMFLGSDRIRVDRHADGSLNVINGRHRMLIARELGIKNLPGEVK